MELRPQRPAAPWDAPGALGELCFVDLGATGPDPSVDAITRIAARRVRGPDPSQRTFERHVVGQQAGDDAPTAAEIWPEFLAFLGDAAVLVAERASFQAWWRHLGPHAEPRLIALDEFEALLLPGRPTAWAVPECPDDLRKRLSELVARFHELTYDAVGLAIHGFRNAWRDLHARAPRTAQILELALGLVEHPGDWNPALEPGHLSAAFDAASLRTAGEWLAPPLEPRWSRREGWDDAETVPVRAQEPTPFAAADRALLDEVFERHLPEQFARAGETPRRREGQHDVARRVAEALGGDELFLVHAPTGTGKTLAYLVPALLWAAHAGVRVGVSTYTRALQEQACDHEVPRARAALALAAPNHPAADPAATRVAVLKGRHNYLCWRALRLHQPDEDDSAEAWLAWTRLTLFAQLDQNGDLDRFPMRAVLGGHDAEREREELVGLVRQVRADSGCCTRPKDRRTCAAEVARQRAERSHVVIANHAFVLARPSWFQHVVFDECEHLHDQAYATWSHEVSIHELRRLLERLRQPRRPTSKAPLDRLERIALEGTPSHEAVGLALATWTRAGQAIEELDAAVVRFRSWAEDVRRERDVREEHSLLREYVEQGVGADLVDARRAATDALDRLEAALAGVAERLDRIPARGLPRLRRQLALLRGDLVEARNAVDAWIPLDEGRAQFRREVFHDVATDSRGRDVLAARVLLPNEFLGRHYYPQLASAAFVSATTWLKGGFDAGRGYLGLDRAAEPAEDEERAACTVTTFRAPDPFDYGRVLVCVPKDAPSYSRNAAGQHDYVRDFIGHLAERTRGRVLALFTNADTLRRTGEELAGFFRARRIPLLYQGMPGVAKEELGERFRARTDSVLLGVDTFWFGADFPGETLEYLVIAKLPYGVPDRYHQAQAAVLGSAEQRRRIYMPRALAKFRQGFGRLMRRETDRGVVFVLDNRVLDPRHRTFLKELPLADAAGDGDALTGARFVRAETDRCLEEAFEHTGLIEELRARELVTGLGPVRGNSGAEGDTVRETTHSDTPSPGLLFGDDGDPLG